MRRVIREHGEIRYEEDKARELDDFLRTYFGNVNDRAGEMRWLRWTSPPVHVLARSGDPRYDFETRVVQVRVRFRRTMLQDTRIITLNDEVVRVVDVPQD
jgi:hypothetical protein